MHLRSGSPRTEKSNTYTKFHSFLTYLSQLMTLMFLYGSLPFFLKTPRIYHSSITQFPVSHPVALKTYRLSLNRLMATASRQPFWQQPTAPDADLPRLFVYNSLTRTKVPFVPIDWKTKKVLWYNCGPTTQVMFRSQSKLAF